MEETKGRDQGIRPMEETKGDRGWGEREEKMCSAMWCGAGVSVFTVSIFLYVSNKKFHCYKVRVNLSKNHDANGQYYFGTTDSCNT